jgi:26S proteasome regulatory subunit N9
LIFKKGKSESLLHFKEISDATQVGLDEVEMLLMKAMSIGLLKGIIDEVDQTLRVTWVKP